MSVLQAYDVKNESKGLASISSSGVDLHSKTVNFLRKFNSDKKKYESKKRKRNEEEAAESAEGSKEAKRKKKQKRKGDE
jgi:hypothetical protein